MLCLPTEKWNLAKFLLPFQDPGRCLVLWSSVRSHAARDCVIPSDRSTLLRRSKDNARSLA